MDSSSKSASANQNRTREVSYNPWNLLFKSRKRTESGSSTSSTNSQNCQSGPPFGGFQKPLSKNNEEYLYMIWRSRPPMAAMTTEFHRK
ncbi:unnamed protein product, partial [Iphiclides podalirius]